MSIVEIGGSGARMQALLSGRVAAVPVHFDQADDLAKRGNYKVLLQPWKEYTHLDQRGVGSQGKLAEGERERACRHRSSEGQMTAFRKSDDSLDWYTDQYQKHVTLKGAKDATDAAVQPVWQTLTQEIKAFPRVRRNKPRRPGNDLLPVYVKAGAIRARSRSSRWSNRRSRSRRIGTRNIVGVAGPKLEDQRICRRHSAHGSGLVPVLDDLSLAIADLEFVAIVGPSGCGKSTFLRIVDGLIPPDSGEIRLNGRVVNGPGHGRGMVFQGFDLFPWRTALGNVEFGLEMKNAARGAPGARARLDRPGRAEGLRGRLSAPVVRRHAAARRASPARSRSTPRCC